MEFMLAGLCVALLGLLAYALARGKSGPDKENEREKREWLDDSDEDD